MMVNLQIMKKIWATDRAWADKIQVNLSLEKSIHSEIPNPCGI